MPHLIITAGAVDGIERCRQFLAAKAPAAARRAAAALDQQLRRLGGTPEMGRPVVDALGLRELVIPFGDSGYVALYRYEPAEDRVYVLAVRHQKEAGYQGQQPIGEQLSR